MIDTRLQLHWAAQAAAGVGRTILPKQADDSHTNFYWSNERAALIQGDDRSGVRFHDLTLLYGDDEFPLAGRTLGEAFHFFESKVGKELERPGEAAPPDHPVAHGEPFAPDFGDQQDMSDLYAAANQELQRFGSPRCWPHHFDLAVLIPYGQGLTSGVGFLAGDAQYPEPYWYVTPGPYPEDRTIVKALPSGFWNTQGWFGAVLLTSSHANVREFLDAAIAAVAP